MISHLIVLTLNVWGLPDVGFKVLAPFRDARMTEICQRLKVQSHETGSWDVILLQEVWLKEDRQKFKNCGYPFALDLNDTRRLMDSGLLLLTKFPVQESHRLTFTVPEVALTQDDGEALVRKSAVMARLDIPGMPDGVWLGNTHLIAQYQSPDIYAEARSNQFRQFAEWAQQTARGAPVILGGDWNIRPQDSLWSDVEFLLRDFLFPRLHDQACTICPPNIFHSNDEGKVDHLAASSAFFAENGKIEFARPFTLEDISLNVSDHYGWSVKFNLRNSR